MQLFRAALAALALMASMASSVGAIPSKPHEKRLLTRDTSRYVFAHFIVGIVSNRTSAADWDVDMQRAKAYGIDAFALNIGTDSFTDTQLAYAYQSAQNNGMKVFISFDFNWYSTGSGNAVGQKVAQYASKPAQFKVDNKVFVSTFNGDGVDVNAIRNAAGTPIYFAPNFHPSYGTDLSQVDGALNWMGWPNNGNNRAPGSGQTGTVEAGDQQYIKALGSKDYVAPASPWFFTHYGPEVSYSKNWLFPGDLLWYQRWTNLLTTGSRFIEIVTWNDYGESHYVGPLNSKHTDDGASKWVNDMPHDGWLDMAKPYIAAFKAGATKVDKFITSDQLIYWYRPQPKTVDCSATDTCMSNHANNPSGNYYIGPPNGFNTVSDSIFVVSLLKSAATLKITSGSNTQTYNAPAGASAYTVPMGVGQQTFLTTRNGQIVASLSGTSLKNIINGCVCGLYNFNAYVGTLPTASVSPLSGAGFGNFDIGLRVSTCSPAPSLGTNAPAASSTANTVPTTTLSSSSSAVASSFTSTSSLTMAITTTATSASTSSSFFSAAISTSSFSSPSSASRSFPFSIPSSFPFPFPSFYSSSTTASSPLSSFSITPSSVTVTASATAAPTACTAGSGPGNYLGLCSFACAYGYCPPAQCTCTAQGATAKALPPSTGIRGVPAASEDDSYAGLCSFACDRGYCPDTACKVARQMDG